jgi:hypothetical protein
MLIALLLLSNHGFLELDLLHGRTNSREIHINTANSKALIKPRSSIVKRPAL